RQHLGMREVKGGRVIELGRLGGNRGDDGFARVARVDAPEARNAIEDFASVLVPIIHALATNQQPRPVLERTVGSEGKPIGLQIIGTRGRAFEHDILRLLEGRAVSVSALAPSTPLPTVGRPRKNGAEVAGFRAVVSTANSG